MFADFDVPLFLEILPHRLVQKPAFIAGVRKRLRGDTAFSISGRIKQIQLNESLTLNMPRVTLDLYPVGILMVQFSGILDGCQPASPDSLRACRRVTGTPLSRLLAAIIDMVSAESSPRLIREAFVFDWSLEIHEEDFQTRLKELEGPAISTLVGAPNQALSSTLLNSIRTDCASLNAKSSRDTLYLNGQGGVRLHAPQREGDVVYRNRAPRLANQFQMALYCHAILTRRMSHLATPMPSTVFVANRLHQWLIRDGSLFPTSVAHQLQWQRIVDAIDLPGADARWRQVEPLTVTADLFRELLAVVEDPWGLPQFPESLDAVSPSTLTFVHDAGLARIITADASEARRSLATSNYRAAVVFAGAAVEGILLALALGSASPAQGVAGLRSNPGYQDLLYKICPDAAQKPVARPANSTEGRTGKNLISTSTAVLLDQVCRPWRNFIHARLAATNLLPADIEEATIAVMALDRLLKEAEIAASSGLAYDKQ